MPPCIQQGSRVTWKGSQGPHSYFRWNRRQNVQATLQIAPVTTLQSIQFCMPWRPSPSAPQVNKAFFKIKGGLGLLQRDHGLGQEEQARGHACEGRADWVPVILDSPEAVELGNGVGRARVERSLLALGNLVHLATHKGTFKCLQLSRRHVCRWHSGVKHDLFSRTNKSAWHGIVRTFKSFGAKRACCELTFP